MEEIFHRIGQQIIKGKLPPGTRIRDVTIAAEMEVSRTPVREALQRFERLGLVRTRPSRHTEVTAVTQETVVETLEFVGHQAGLAARMAIPKLMPEDRAHAAHLIEQMDAALDSGLRTSQTRWAVFSYLSERSGNASHAALMNEFGVVMLRNLRGWVVPSADRDHMRLLHPDFLDATLQGDGDEAERLTRAMFYV